MSVIEDKIIVLKEGEHVYVEIDNPHRQTKKVYRIENVEGKLEYVEVGKVRKVVKEGA